MRIALAAGVLAVLLAACELGVAPSVDLAPVPASGTAPTTPPSPSAASATPTPAETGTPAPVEGNPMAEAAAGPWRPAPLPIPAGFADGFVRACVAANPALEGLPVALTDVRGEGVAATIFGEAAVSDEAWLCRGPLDAAGGADVRVDALPIPDAPIGDEAVDLLRYEAETTGDGERTWAVGRAGRNGIVVQAGFTDESYVESTKRGGWYVIWWPGTPAPEVINILNRQFVSIGSVVPPGPPPAATAP